MASERQMLEAYEAKGDINPAQASRLKELRSAGAMGHPGGIESPTGSYLTSSPSQPTAGGINVPTMQDFSGIVSQAQKMYGEAAKPQVEALEAEKPSIETRYQNLIADITKTGRAAKTAEYARRGIPVSSGMLEHELGQQLAGPIATAGEARSAELTGLAQTIANLQAGGQTNAIQTALSLLGMQTSAQQSASELALRRWAEEEATRRAQMETPATQLAKKQFETEWPYQQAMYEYELGKPYYKPETEDTFAKDLEDVIRLLGGGEAGPTETTPAYTPAGGAGAFSSSGEWYFDGMNWIPVVE
jgi:hypothetical protein